eukprot:TRINITY_DN50092_c0_g1_i1.p1 TRINITY_DN50092_c0_g1~~TRINITY_DN50092_c0_g1_i1.p1  ORF type:complete len:193 (+),score=36.88 TRINITY_DN50092_c0_g1_i1:182-760(+)
MPTWMAQAGLAMVWVGAVLGVSWMEAWVKFRAPLLTKPVAFDVGRHVFRGLNAIETPMAFTLLALNALENMTLTAWRLAAGVSSIVALQVLYLTRELERAAFHRIVAGIPDTADQSELVEELRTVVKHSHPPTRWLHVAYVVLEAVKVGVLVWYAWECVMTQSSSFNLNFFDEPFPRKTRAVRVPEDLESYL